MAENKREQRTQTISKDRTDSFINSTKRHINTIEFHNTATSDGTGSMRTYIEGLINFAGVDGFPTSFHFYVTKNKNPSLTDANKVIELTIPIFPVVCNVNSRESINSFIKNAGSPEVVKAMYEQMPPADINARITQYANKIMNYITTELALRYLVAKSNGDKIIMNQIRNLKVMKDQDFDFKLFEAIANNPKTMRRKKDGVYLVFENNGNEDLVAISDEQAQKYAGYKDAVDKFPAIERQFTSLNADIETYRLYDINESKIRGTIGNNSLKNKRRGDNVISDKTTPTTSTPSQPGSDE